MVAFDVRFESAEWLGAWKPEAKRVVLSAPPSTRMKERVAVKVHLASPSVRATLIGTVVSLQKAERHSRVELAVEADSLDAARMLQSAAQGEPMRFRERQPRYLVKLPVVATTGGPTVYASTISISLSGCSLRWSGSMPGAGESVALSIRGSRSVEMVAVVRWRKPASSTLGLRFERVRGAEVWQALMEEVKKSGAPVA
ncbi:MAG TPA: PilZ domain-containing protein [Anaeromyxobacteraceae bacterium]|nr:PilZ domain-containing protein [Anaeromyxobacteraceae bacterium]